MFRLWAFRNGTRSKRIKHIHLGSQTHTYTHYSIHQRRRVSSQFILSFISHIPIMANKHDSLLYLFTFAKIDSFHRVCFHHLRFHCQCVRVIFEYHSAQDKILKSFLFTVQQNHTISSRSQFVQWAMGNEHRAHNFPKGLFNRI